MSTSHHSLQNANTSSAQYSGMMNQSDVMTDYLDVRELISKVKRRPGLWDPECPDYWDRSIKRRFWEEIVQQLMNREGATIAEKKQFGNIIQRRWKSLKGSYSREYQRLSKLKLKDSCFKSPYYYFNHLSFLGPTISKPSVVYDDVEDSDIPESIDVEDRAFFQSCPPPVKLLRRKRPPREDVKPFKRIREDKEEDEEKLFLMTLLSPLKKIPQHLRLSVQMELLQVLQRAQSNITIQYAQVPLLFYHSPVLQTGEEAAQPPLLPQSVIAEAESKPSTQRLVVMHKLTPPSTPSSLNTLSDTELELFQASA